MKISDDRWPTDNIIVIDGGTLAHLFIRVNANTTQEKYWYRGQQGDDVMSKLHPVVLTQTITIASETASVYVGNTLS